MASLTSQQGIISSPRHLIPHLMCLGVCVCHTLYFAFLSYEIDHSWISSPSLSDLIRIIYEICFITDFCSCSHNFVLNLKIQSEDEINYQLYIVY